MDEEPRGRVVLRPIRLFNTQVYKKSEADVEFTRLAAGWRLSRAQMWHARYLRAIAEVCFLEKMLKRRPLIVRLFSRKTEKKIREQIEKWKGVAVKCKAMELTTRGCILQRRGKGE